MPKKIPTAAEKPNARVIAHSGTWAAGRWAGTTATTSAPTPQQPPDAVAHGVHLGGRRRLDVDLDAVGRGAPEQLEGGAERQEDPVVEVGAQRLALRLHHPDDGHRQVADVDLLAQRLAAELQLVDDLGPDHRHFAMVLEV